MFEIIQGESIQKGFRNDKITSTGPSWSVTWFIVKNLGGTKLIEGTGTAVAGVFTAIIDDTQTIALTPGKYYLVLRIKDSITKFAKEIQEPFTVNMKG